MAPQHRVDVLVPCGITHIFQTGPSVEQLFDDRKVIGPRLVDGRPDSRTEDRTAVHAARLEWSFAPDEQPYGFKLPTVRGPVEGVQTRVGSRRWIDTLRQQVVCDARPAEKARARQRFCKRLRFIAEESLFIPLDYPRGTGRSPPAAPHPVSPRRSCSRLQVTLTWRGLPPLRPSALSGALERDFQRGHLSAKNHPAGLGPRDCLCLARIEFANAPTDFVSPGSFGILVDRLVKTLDE